MPKVTTWKIPVALWVAGFIAKVIFSIVINDTVGNWVGGTLGFLAFVTFGLYSWHLSKEQKSAS